MLSTTPIFPKTPRLKNHRPKFSGIFIHTDPSSPPIRWFHREMRASDSRCVETNALEGRGEQEKTEMLVRENSPCPPQPILPSPLEGEGPGVRGLSAKRPQLVIHPHG